MTMEINGQPPIPAGASGDSAGLRSVRGDDADRNTRAPETAPRPADTISLTGEAALMQRLDAEIAATPIVDQARVDDLRQQILDGTYRIDPERVAEKLIASETALFGPARR